MKRNEDFYEPRRQSQWAIIFIILKFLRRLLSQLWPILLAFFIGRGNQRFDRFEIAISVLGIFGMFTSIVSYYKYYYYMSDSDLIIEKGVFRKVRLNVPFERVQSVNFNQNFLHQLLGVTEVEIETAGSDQSELRIDALDLLTAERLRHILLRNRDARILADDTDIDEESVTEPILELDILELLRVGLVQNHFKPIGLLFGLVGSAFVYAYSFDYDPKDLFIAAREFSSDFSIKEYILILVFLILISIIYSLADTVLRHYNLLFIRVKNKFQVTQGLITKKQFAALDNKIQIYSWGQNPIEKRVGFYNIYFRQAISSEEKGRTMQFKIPGCPLAKVDFVKDAWLGPNAGEFNEHYGVSKHYFYRPLIYSSVIFGSLLILFLYFGLLMATVGSIFSWGLIISLSYLRWKKKTYAFNGQEVYLGGGTLGHKHSLLPVYKIQNISVHQNPYQWRRSLANLHIHTAAGYLVLPYISEKHAYELLDRFIYAVEISRKPWM